MFEKIDHAATADLVARILQDDSQALEASERFFQYYPEQANYLERTYDSVERIGIEKSARRPFTLRKRYPSIRGGRTLTAVADERIIRAMRICCCAASETVRMCCARHPTGEPADEQFLACP